MRDSVSMPSRARSSTRAEPAGLALEMKAQRQHVHVLERDDREPAHRVHRHLGEHAVAHLREQRHDDARDAVGKRHDDRRGQRPGRPRHVDLAPSPCGQRRRSPT